MQSTLKKIFAIFVMLTIFPASSNCLTKQEAQKLNEITLLYYNLASQTTTDFLEQIKETKDGDFICLKSTEASLLAEQELISEIADWLPIFYSKCGTIMNNVLKRLKSSFFDQIDQNEKEERKLALICAITYITKKIDMIMKDSYIETYLQDKSVAKNYWKFGIPLSLIGFLIAKHNLPINAMKNEFADIGIFTISAMIALMSLFYIPISWLTVFTSGDQLKQKIKKIKNGHSEFVRQGILNPHYQRLGFKKKPEGKYISDQALIKIFNL